MRDEESDFLGGMVVGAFLALLLWFLLVCPIIFKTSEEQSNENTWGESAEFTQLETGQNRFSLHNTNVKDFPVIVDHSTGIMYMRGVGVLVDENGKPLRVLEVGE